MKTLKKALCIVLSLITAFSLILPAFADDAPEEEAPAEQTAELKSLDTSAVDGKLKAYVGVETYFVVYPEPLEAEDKFDIRNAVITCSNEGIIEARAEKVEEYRFGNVTITGLKVGSTTVTVTEPESGVSCSVVVTVYPPFGYYLRNFFSFLEYVPFFIYMRIMSRFYNS